jgi:ribonuclease HII
MEVDGKVQKRSRATQQVLERFYNNPPHLYELSIDEAGRGCLFGRVYIACVVLPKDPSAFCGKDIKDSKKFSSKKRLNEAAAYIKDHALAWHVAYLEADVVDNVNILKAVMQGMHECIRETILKLNTRHNTTYPLSDFMAVIDGNYFTPYIAYDDNTQTLQQLSHVTVEKGDGTYMAIAAASILAKTSRDNYVLELCEKYPLLSQRYGLDANMGYGTKTHLDGIQQYGITQWHRKSFGCCKTAVVNNIEEDA